MFLEVAFRGLNNHIGFFDGKRFAKGFDWLGDSYCGRAIWMLVFVERAVRAFLAAELCP